MTTQGNEGKWIEVLLTSGFALAFLKFLQWLLSHLFARKQKTDVLAGIQALHSVYLTMEKCLGPNCQRVLLLAAHNSGGIPTASSPFYTSAIHWATTDVKQRKMLNSYTNLKVDGAYVAMLLELQSKGVHHFDMSRNEGSMLREIYEAEGIKDSVLVFIGIKNNQFLYMSFASFDGCFKQEDVTRFRLAANEVKNMVA